MSEVPYGNIPAPMSAVETPLIGDTATASTPPRAVISIETAMMSPWAIDFDPVPIAVLSHALPVIPPPPPVRSALTSKTPSSMPVVRLTS